jgi:antitoxin CptB
MRYSAAPFAWPGFMDTRRKKLRFRAWRRGFREIDLILGSFADANMENLDPAALDAFEALLDALDGDVYAWIVGQAPVPPEHNTPLFTALQSHANKGATS